MPPTGYLSVTGIASALQHLATTYSSICQLIPLPESSIEDRTIRGLKIAGGQGGERRGVLLIAGVHARELINPDLLVWFALRLCQAYTANSGLTFGAKTYEAETIKLLVNGLDLFFLPLVNPDGRDFVQSPTGYAMWRKNRNPNPGMPCMGVDLNRNFDFLWSSGIGTSSNSCSDIFKGHGAFSEPETSNVRYLLDTYPNIGYFVDVHSYSELILYPWGDDDNQTIDPTMNFQNPAYDGQRGTPGDSLYREYIPQSDLDWYVSTGNRVRDAIAAVRGRTYTVQQGVGLYPTTGTSEDYVYTRHFVDSSKGKVRGFILETGTEFQAPYSEALRVIEEVSAGLVEFCLACLCAVEETLHGMDRGMELNQMQTFRDQLLSQSPVGRKYIAILENHTAEVVDLMARNAKLHEQLSELLLRVNEVTRTWQESTPRVFSPELIATADELLQTLAAQGSTSLKQGVEVLRQDLIHFRGQTVLKGLELANCTSD